MKRVPVSWYHWWSPTALWAPSAWQQRNQMLSMGEGANHTLLVWWESWVPTPCCAAPAGFTVSGAVDSHLES